MTDTKPIMTDLERRAVDRAKRAKIKADERTILSFVRCVGADAVLRATLRDIFLVANAF